MSTRQARILLAAFLLGVGLCFVPASGHGKISQLVLRAKVTPMSFELLKSQVEYMMHNPNSFLNVSFDYDPTLEGLGKALSLPEHLDTRFKIIVRVYDNRGIFSYKSGVALRDEFKRKLKVIYSFINFIATDINTDIVAVFCSTEGIPLGYFYQGEYHLWEK